MQSQSSTSSLSSSPALKRLSLLVALAVCSQTQAAVITYDVATGATATSAAVVTGTNSILKIGGGTQVLIGTHSYTGGTTINAGTLQVGVGGTSGSLTGDVLNNGVLSVNRSGAITLNDNISGSGSLTKSGGGSLP